MILEKELSTELCDEIISAQKQLAEAAGIAKLTVAVRSSATAEDLPTAEKSACRQSSEQPAR